MATILGAAGHRAARKFLFEALPGIQIIRAKGVDEVRGRTIIAQFDDKDYSLCDAIAFAVMERRVILCR